MLPGRLFRTLLTGVVLATLASATRAEDSSWTPTQKRVAPKTLPAEFSQQDAVLISWDESDEGMQNAVADIVAAAHDRIRFCMLVPNVAAEIEAQRLLRHRGVSRQSVRFMQVPTDSIWTRDYGPMIIVGKDGSSRMVDCDYGHGDRVGDDLVPAAIAPSLGMDTLRPPITADGGNIQTNGRGLALTTTALVAHNSDRGYTEAHVSRLFKDYYGISQLVFLEPLSGETTGHVDMFAVFVGPNTVVVGQYAREEDPVNAAILDRNAGRLASLETADGPLRVIRIPMPPHDERVFRTYTNVLFANGTLLIPEYPGVDPEGHQDALAIYRRLLPGWKVTGIDCNGLIEWGGAIHCVTMNLCRIPSAAELTDQLSRERTDRRPTRPPLAKSKPISNPREFRNSSPSPADSGAEEPPPTGKFPPLIVRIREKAGSGFLKPSWKASPRENERQIDSGDEHNGDAPPPARPRIPLFSGVYNRTPQSAPGDYGRANEQAPPAVSAPGRPSYDPYGRRQGEDHRASRRDFDNRRNEGPVEADEFRQSAPQGGGRYEDPGLSRSENGQRSRQQRSARSMFLDDRSNGQRRELPAFSEEDETAR